MYTYTTNLLKNAHYQMIFPRFYHRQGDFSGTGRLQHIFYLIKFMGGKIGENLSGASEDANLFYMALIILVKYEVPSS